MKLRKILIPKPIIMRVPGGALMHEPDGSTMEPWTMVRYLEALVLSDPAWPKSYRAAKVAARLCELSTAQFTFTLPVEDWRMLRDVVQEPRGEGVNGFFRQQLVPFMDAILDAEEIDG